MINAGELHEIISIETSTKTRNSTGGYSAAWADLSTDIRARVVANKPEFIDEEGKRYHQQTYMVTIRKGAASLTDIGQIRIDWLRSFQTYLCGLIEFALFFYHVLLQNYAFFCI